MADSKTGANGGIHTPQSRGVVYSPRLPMKREAAILAIPTTYVGLNSGPSPGAVVGIVLGSVFGFLLVIWFIYTCGTFDGSLSNAFIGWGRRTVIEEDIILRRERSRFRPVSSHERLRTRDVRPRSVVASVSSERGGRCVLC